jgi:hypothetical protein
MPGPFTDTQVGKAKETFNDAFKAFDEAVTTAEAAAEAADAMLVAASVAAVATALDTLKDAILTLEDAIFLSIKKGETKIDKAIEFANLFAILVDKITAKYKVSTESVASLVEAFADRAAKFGENIEALSAVATAAAAAERVIAAPQPCDFCVSPGRSTHQYNHNPNKEGAPYICRQCVDEPSKNKMWKYGTRAAI